MTIAFREAGSAQLSAPSSTRTAFAVTVYRDIEMVEPLWQALAGQEGGGPARLGDRVHFLHLRNVRRESGEIAGSFHEAEHLGGGTDMVALIAEVLGQEARRRAAGRNDHSIPMRPDHGHDILDDLKRQAQPGYPAIGRLRGLAELRGIITALSHPRYGIAG
jgi:hypothetical protein